MAEIVRGINERDVGKRLGEISHEAPRACIIFLRQEADVVAQPEQPLEQLLGLLLAAKEIVGVRQPEAAGEKGAFARRQSVIGLVRAIAMHKAVNEKVAFDGCDRALHSWI